MRSAFLSAFSAVYTCAFVSYWLQFEGLYGADGLLPVSLHHTRVSERLGSASPRDKASSHPSLLWLLRADDDVDTFVEGLTLLGIILATLSIAGLHHGSLYLAMFVIYLTLFVEGQTFLSFQWDLFLLETGALTVLYAPWFAFSADADESSAAHPMTWPLRLLWVKV